MSKTTGSLLKSTISVTDMFCGAGGSSQGARSVNGVEILQAMNHWQLAIETHNTNFPNVLHDCADVSQAKPDRYHSTTVLWASPECPWHGNAQGKKRKGAQLSLLEEKCEEHGIRGCPTCTDDQAGIRSRATMYDPLRFAEYHNYQVVIVENVIEARKWRLFDGWLKMWDALGYRHQIVYLNSKFAHLRPLPAEEASQDRYAPQSRDRMYVVFTKKVNPAPDLEIRPLGWCPHCEKNVEAIQSWKNTPAVRRWGGRWGAYGAQYLYRCPRCAKEVAPFHYAAFNAIDWTIPTQRIGDRKKPLEKRTMERGRVGIEKYGHQPLVIDLAYPTHNGRVQPVIYRSMPTQTTAQTLGLLSPMLTSVNYYDDRNIPVDETAATQTTGEKWGVTVPPAFLAYLRNHMDGAGLDSAAATVSAGGNHHALLTLPPAFLSSYYSGSDVNALVDEASRTIPTVARHALFAAPFWIPYANGDGPPHSVDEAFGTQHTANSFGMFMPNEVPELEEWGFRMLATHEIGAIMAFGSDYVVLGKKEDKIRQYGNAVTPPAARLLIERSVATLQ